MSTLFGRDLHKFGYKPAVEMCASVLLAATPNHPKAPARELALARIAGPGGSLLGRVRSSWAGVYPNRKIELVSQFAN